MSRTTRSITNHLKSKLSKTAAQIVTDNIGYRNDYLFDGNGHQILDVIAYEHDELGNTDIFDFVKKMYHINITKHSDKFKAWLETIFQTGVDHLFGYWVTTEDSCISLYTDTLDDEITKLTLPTNYLILSDLSIDGCLIVTDQPKSANESVQMKLVKDIEFE